MSGQTTTNDSASNGILNLSDKQINSALNYQSEIINSDITNSSTSRNNNIKSDNTEKNIENTIKHKRSENIQNNISNKKFHLDKNSSNIPPKGKANLITPVIPPNTVDNSFALQLQSEQQPLVISSIMKSNTNIKSDIYSSNNIIGATNNRNDRVSSYSLIGGKQIKRPPSPSGVKLSKRSMTHLENQYISNENKRVSYSSSDYYPTSKFIPTTNTLNPSLGITSQKDYVTELNKKAYTYPLSTSTSAPPFSSPSYEEHQTPSSNGMLMYSKQGFNDHSQLNLQETKLKDENTSSSILNSDLKRPTNTSMDNSLNTILLDSISSNFNFLSTDNTENTNQNLNNAENLTSNQNINDNDNTNDNESNDNSNKSLQDSLPTPCSSINSTPTNRQGNNNGELNTTNLKETINKSTTLSDNIHYNGQEELISNDEITGNSSISTVTNLNINRKPLEKSFSLSLMTPESSTVSGIIKDNKSSMNSSCTVTSSIQSKSINLPYSSSSSSSSRNHSFSTPTSEFNNTPNSSLVSLSNTISGRSKYPINNHNLTVTSSSEFRPPFISTSSTSSMNALASKNNNPLSNITLNEKDSTTLNEVTSFNSKTSFQNDENNDSRTIIESQLLLQNNYNPLTEIQSMNNDQQETKIKNHQSFVQNQYQQPKEETNASIPQQPEKIDSLQLNEPNNTQILFDNNRLSSKALMLERNQSQLAQSIPEIYDNDQQNTLPFDNDNNQETIFTQQFSQDENNNITEGTIENGVSFNINPNESLNEQPPNEKENLEVSIKPDNNDLYKSSYSSSIPPSYKNEQTLMNNQNNSFININEKSLVKTTKNQSEEPKLILIPWEDKNTFVFQLKVGTRTLSRRIDNHTVNGTKLLNIGGLTRGRRDGILKNEKERNVIKHGPLNLKGVWIPLSRARLITEKHNINPEVNIILEDDPSKYLDKESQMELKGKYEPYMRIKDRYADNDYISNKYSGVMGNYFQNSMPPQSSNQKFDPYFAQYISNNHNGLSELPTENMGNSSTGIHHPLTQNTNYMNPCDLNFIIHGSKKNFGYNGNEPTYYKPSQNDGFQQGIRQGIQQGIQQDVRYNFQYPNINKPLKKNAPPTQQSINQFTQLPRIHSQLPSNSYPSIYDNPNIQYNNPLPKQIPTSTFNNLSNYSSNPNTSIIYQNYNNWIDNNNIASINSTKYNGNNSKYNDEGIPQMNNSNYNGFSSNNINY
ncbi:hypothetical protein H8356DRAFT_1316077 [Neocallimastix lanati (nom. inval.)]|nr:hypothetical protein H8356DRAFT_1316077 [Neocallimastix sp. JGI-2020a]